MSSAGFFNGQTIYRNLSVDAGGANVKGSKGSLFGGWISNQAAAVRYLKFYDKATTPVVGTDTPVMTIALPANWAGSLDSVLGDACPDGIVFTNGIGVGATTAIADNSVAAPAANDVTVNLFYK